MLHGKNVKTVSLNVNLLLLFVIVGVVEMEFLGAQRVHHGVKDTELESRERTDHHTSNNFDKLKKYGRLG